MKQKNYCISVGINTPAKIELYKKYDKIKDLASFALQITERLTFLNVEDIIKITNSFKDFYFGEEIDSFLLLINIIIHLIEDKINDLQYYSYYKYLTILLRAKKAVFKTDTLRRKLLAYRTFYAIYEANKEKK